MQSMINDIHMYILNCLDTMSHSTKLKINYFSVVLMWDQMIVHILPTKIKQCSVT